MLKFKITSLVAASLVVLTINKPQVLAQDAGGASVEGSCDAAYASGDDEEHPFVPGGDDEYGNKDGLTEGGVVKDDARPSDDECENQEERCDFWAGLGKCSANPNYMTAYCRRSCKLCPDQKNMTDTTDKGTDFGEPQLLEHLVYNVVEVDGARRILESREYMEGLTIDKALLDLCKNKHESCTVWALYGECTKNPGYMTTQCAPACLSCDNLLIEKRCPIDPDAVPAWQPGDLDAMFQRLVEEPFASEYDVKVLSRDPWVITMEGIVNDEEAERLIELGAAEGYKRSSDVGAKQADGTYGSHVSSGRTSTNAWCQNECYQDPVALRVIERLSNITGINEPNSEYLQLLRYEPGQFYNTHHDYIDHNKHRQQGVRILTAFLYLNDVEAGGGTNFDKLAITVMPKRGRALLWPSVLDSKPHDKDGRTTHQALPVTAGIKYGANAWFHQFDFKTPNKNGCSS